MQRDINTFRISTLNTHLDLLKKNKIKFKGIVRKNYKHLEYKVDAKCGHSAYYSIAEIKDFIKRDGELLECNECKYFTKKKDSIGRNIHLFDRENKKELELLLADGIKVSGLKQENKKDVRKNSGARAYFRLKCVCGKETLKTFEGIYLQSKKGIAGLCRACVRNRKEYGEFYAVKTMANKINKEIKND